MLLRQRKVINLSATVILLIWLHDSTTEARRRDHTCPLGFNLSYTRDKEDPICYRLKGPEAFTDKFKDCAGNIYSYKLYSNLNFNRSDIKLWAEYKSLYPGGPLIDWSYAESTGDILTSTFNIKYDSDLGIEEELCAIATKDGLKAVTCEEIHYRYCFVTPYDDLDDMSHEGCEELPDYWRFWSPKPTCLAAVVGVGGGTVRATWNQAQELCARRNGSLLQRGWRYANNMLLHETDDRNVTDPLGIIMTPGDTLLWIDPEDGNNVVSFLFLFLPSHCLGVRQLNATYLMRCCFQNTYLPAYLSHIIYLSQYSGEGNDVYGTDDKEIPRCMNHSRFFAGKIVSIKLLIIKIFAL